MATPEEIKALKDQITELNKQLDDAGGTAIDLGKAFAKSGDDANKLNNILGDVKKRLTDITDNSNYIFRTFQDITAELKSQNLLLKVGNGAFKAFSDIAQNINYYQKGNLDLTDKQIKKSYQTLDIEKKELEFVIERLGNKKGEFYQDSRISSLQDEIQTADAARKKILEARLGILIKEKALYNNAKEAIASGIPVLQKELDLSKQIFTVRQDLGGIAVNASKILTKFGGSLSQFLNINEAVTSAEEYNKKIVLGALNSKKVQNQLLEVEKKKVDIQNQLDTGRFKDEKTGKFIKVTEEERIKRQEQLISLEKDAEKIKLNAIASTNTLVNKFKILGVLTKEMGVGLAKSLTDPITLITFFGKAAFKADQQATALGKSLGVSKMQAQALREEFVKYSANANDTFVTTDRLVKAQAELSEQLGIAVQFSGEELTTFSKLTEIVGLSAQEAGKLAFNSAAAGVNATDYVKQIRSASFAAQQVNKVHFSDKQILQDISKLSAGILVKFQNNPKALVEANIQAKKLGTTLEQVEKVGESLLNFESSIENELKAELLTGKQINLEKARYAALTGDQATLTQELANQVGSLADFQKMNVIAQKSLAEAFGMSRDEVAEMLMKQEAINTFGKETEKLNKQQLEDFQKQNEATGIGLDAYLQKQAEQQSAQDNFNNSILKLQDLLAGLVSGPIGQLIGGFAEMVNHAMILKPLVGAIAGLVAGKMVMGIFNFGKGLVAAIPKLATMVGLSSAKAVAEVTAAEAISFGLATVGIIAGIASVVAAMNSAGSTAASDAQSVKDGMAPAGKGPFTITDSYGATAITAKGDGIAVSPNIDATSISSNRQSSLDLTPISNTISALSNAVNGLINRPQPSPQFALHVDGRQLGTVVGNQMETGTAQNMTTSYKVA